jgi:hypothetical protein
MINMEDDERTEVSSEKVIFFFFPISVYYRVNVLELMAKTIIFFISFFRLYCHDIPSFEVTKLVAAVYF